MLLQTGYASIIFYGSGLTVEYCAWALNKFLSIELGFRELSADSQQLIGKRCKKWINEAEKNIIDLGK
jgi:hypothetical protein